MPDAAGDLLTGLCHDLGALRAGAGGPSLRVLAAQVGLGKSQLGAILRGQVRAIPDWSVVRGVVAACHRYARESGRVGPLPHGGGLEEYWRPRYAAVEHLLSQPRVPTVPPRADAFAPVVPRQLPPPVRRFVGRRAELAALAGAAGPVVLSGAAGVGKTALAVSWAHRVAARFPDGQLYVNLRGFDPAGAALTAAEAVRGFLDAFAVPPHRVPAGRDAQVGLYRSLLADRRVLVVLDNARDAEQVRPLLPGSPGCLAVVTSRGRLAGLVATEGAEPLWLDLLSPAEATELLASRVGADRLAAERAAATRLVAACARLPLALCVVAGRAAVQPALSLAALLAELQDARAGLDAFDGGDPAADVRAVFSWSYHLLPAGAARLFRLLGLHWGDEVTLPAAASLAGVPAAGARRDVAELVEAGLLAERTPGRYALHDLLRTYAGELLAGTDTEADRGAALHRLVEHHLHTALAAALLTHPHFSRIDVPPAGPGVTPQPLVDAAAAGRWFTAEHPILVATVGHAARAGLDRHAWQLAWAIAGHLDRRGRWAEWSAVGEAALAAATRAGDRSGQAHAHRDLARVRSRQGRPDDAQAHLLRALELFGPAGDRAGLAHTHLNLGQALERAGRVRQALGHSEQALELFAAAGSAAGHAFALNAVGWQHALLGDHRRAVSYCEEALHRLAALGDEQGQADTWDSLGYAHHHLGDHRRAIDCYRRALAVFTATGNRYGEASTLDNLGQAHLAAADVRAARDAWRSALTIFHQLGHADAERVLDRLGDLERAAAPHGSLLGSAPA